MKSNRKIILLLSLVLCCSCKNHTARNNSFGSVVNDAVQDEICSLSGSNVVKDLNVIDSSHILIHYIYEPFFSILNLADSSVSASFGRLGRSSNELLKPPQHMNYRDGKIQTFEHGRNSLLTLSVPEGNIEFVSVPVTADFRPAKVVEIDGKRIVVGSFKEGYVAYLDKYDEVHIVSDFPFETGGLEGIYRAARIQSVLVSAPTLSKFLVSTLSSDCFEIYNVSESGVKRSFINDYKYPPVLSGSVIDNSKSKAGYINHFVTDEYIYLLYSEESQSTCSKQGDTSNEIHVFDWEGNRIRTIQLPKRVHAFCVCGSTLYGIVETEDINKVVGFSIYSNVDKQVN